jgi:hypothetical protein
MADLAAFWGKARLKSGFVPDGQDGMGIAWYLGNDGTGRCLPNWRALALFGDVA